jgi:hypothetical protein
MQVQYRIPGWEPIRAVPIGAEPAAISPFPVAARAAPAIAAVSWRTLLRLDHPVAGAVILRPPERPHASVVDDAISQRRLMRDLVTRHGLEADPSRTGNEQSRAVRDMLLLLLDFQSSRDELDARRLEQEAM